MSENEPCHYCGCKELTFAVIGFTTEIVCAKCGKMPYEKDEFDKQLENSLIDALDQEGIEHGWKKN